jgi:hypothetical protein
MEAKEEKYKIKNIKGGSRKREIGTEKKGNMMKAKKEIKFVFFYAISEFEISYFNGIQGIKHFTVNKHSETCFRPLNERIDTDFSPPSA